MLPAYAELHCRSNFSFLTGASHPEELIERAAELGYTALAITDECSLAGVVRAHAEAKRIGLHLIVGAEMRLSSPYAVKKKAVAAAAATKSRSASSSARWAKPAGPAPSAMAAGAKPSAQAIGATASAQRVSAGMLPGMPRGTRVPSPTSSSAAHGLQGHGGAASPSPSVAREAEPAVAPLPAVDTDGAASQPRLVLLAQSRRGYGNLSQWITLARRRAEKGRYLAHASDVEGKVPAAPHLAGLPDCFALLVPAVGQSFETVFAHAMWLKTWFGSGGGPDGRLPRAAIALELLLHDGEADLVDVVQRVAMHTGLAIVAAGDVLMHVRSRKPLQDTLAATRFKRAVAQCGRLLAPNAEQHLRSRARLTRLYAPEWLEASVAIAAQCAFSLDELRYEYPEEIVPAGHTPASWLRALTEQGAKKRFPNGVPRKVAETIEHELSLIAQLRYEPYFLTVADVVQWARAQGILCQGRGSAANSAVCYCLQVTEVDPARMSLLFERFVSAERNEPPDIDVDFEHQRREEVIQYIYRKYGRHRAALTAVVISYRPRSALRDVGRALGFDLSRIDAVAKSQHWFDGRRIDGERLRENGFDPESPLVKLWIELTQSLIGFPRHLSQHPGGFVIARDDVSRLVPVENASMPDRTVIQWDKDDLDVLGLIKVDVLALGMLSAIRRALAFVAAKLGRSTFEMQDVPSEDPAVYEMLSRGDSVGTFQVESRAQMSMLPRLRPKEFYDLVIEVAIVRPGPIQGGMVHPYLKRRNGEEPVDYPSDEVKQALERTLGVPIFQEQVMQLAILAADFTPGEADKLRRAMAAWKRKGGLGPFHERLVGRMVEKGYSREYAERIFKQIEGFGEYGFPESHAASFALLVYVSAWIKRHHPDAFLAGLLNSQPMGFYAPAQLVRDAREHGVEVRPVDVLASACQTSLEFDGVDVPDAKRRAMRASRRRDDAAGTPVVTAPLVPVRLGFDRIGGFAEEAAQRIVAARAEAPLQGAEDLARRAKLDARMLELLAHADALSRLPWSAPDRERPVDDSGEAAPGNVGQGFEARAAASHAPRDGTRDMSRVGHRHQAAWVVGGVDTRPTAMLERTRTHESPIELPPPDEADETLADYRALGLTLKKHPLALLREELSRFRVQPAAVLKGFRHGQLARASGLVTHRQRPETARGTVFVTLEDETGHVNVIVWPKVVEQQRQPLLASTLLTVYGTWQREGDVMHLVAAKLVDHSELLRGLTARSRNFR